MFTRRGMLKWLGLGCMVGAPAVAVARELPTPAAAVAPKVVGKPLVRVVWSHAEQRLRVNDLHGRNLHYVTKAKVYLQEGKRGSVKFQFYDPSIVGRGLARKNDTVTQWCCEIENGKAICRDEYGDIVEGAEVVSWEVEARSGARLWSVVCSCEV